MPKKNIGQIAGIAARPATAAPHIAPNLIGLEGTSLFSSVTAFADSMVGS